jgi:hypothetical protein
MPSWIEFGIAVLGGTGLKAAFDWLTSRNRIQFDREAALWSEIGALRARFTILEAEMKELHADRDRLLSEANDGRLTILVLQSEVNELLEDLGKGPKYDIGVLTRKATTMTREAT